MAGLLFNMRSVNPARRDTSNCRESGTIVELSVDSATDVPGRKLAKPLLYVDASGGTNHLRPRAVAPSWSIAGHQPAAGRHEGMQHELRVLPVRMDARSGEISRAGHWLAHRASRGGGGPRTADARGRNRRTDRPNHLGWS